MSAIPQTEQWIEFFSVYRRLPALWKGADGVYKNKRLKIAAYNQLLSCYLKIDPQANVDSMRRRMNGIRTCFRRELRKVEHSESVAKTPDDVYVPHLWYFQELTFLRGDLSANNVLNATVEEASNSCWNEEDADMDETTDDLKEQHDDFHAMETKIEQPLEEPHQPAISNSCLDHTSPHQSPVSNSCLEHVTPSVDQSMDHSQLMPQLLRNLGHQPHDEASIYAEGWATSYRKLDERNKLLAKKAIEEILVLGQLNKLEFNSVKMPQ